MFTSPEKHGTYTRKIQEAFIKLNNDDMINFYNTRKTPEQLREAYLEVFPGRKLF